MANIIKVSSTDEIRNKAAQIETKKREMDTQMTNMKNIVSSLQSSWTADSEVNYEEKYQQLSGQIALSLEEISTYVQKLKRTADIYDKGESDVKGKVNNLTNENIF